MNTCAAAVEEDQHTTLGVQVTVFDSVDGVRSNLVFSGLKPRVAKTADGRLWFLPVDGVSVVDPRHLRRNELPPPVHIEQITADHATYDAARGLRLPPLVRDLQIEYTALSFVAPEKNTFRIMLEGRDPGTEVELRVPGPIAYRRAGPPSSVLHAGADDRR